ncbi:hypothetical protein D9M70_619230 [compost metagenome]
MKAAGIKRTPPRPRSRRNIWKFVAMNKTKKTVNRAPSAMAYGKRPTLPLGFINRPIILMTRFLYGLKTQTPISTSEFLIP